jgi:hypothetical protein
VLHFDAVFVAEFSRIAIKESTFPETLTARGHHPCAPGESPTSPRRDEVLDRAVEFVNTRR